MTEELNSKRPRCGTRWRPSVRRSGSALRNEALPAVNKVKHLLRRSGWCKIKWKKITRGWEGIENGFFAPCSVPFRDEEFSPPGGGLTQPWHTLCANLVISLWGGAWKIQLEELARVHKMCDALRHFNHRLLLLRRRLSRCSYQLPLDS